MRNTYDARLTRYYLLLILIVTITYGIAVLWGSRNISDSLPSPSGEKLGVVASFYPHYYFAKEIAGAVADVSNLTPAGAEPHDFEPAARDLAKVAESDLLIVNGLVEPWLADVAKNLAGRDTAILTLADGMTLENNDPHIWLDPVLAKGMAEKIRDVMIAKDPSGSMAYRANAGVLSARLDSLHASFQDVLSQCRQKNIVTAHTAFGYLAKRYGLTQVGIAGLEPEAEPSAKDLADVAAFARTNNIQYIFFETLVSPKLAETIAREVGAKTLVLNPLEGLSPEDMAAGKNYFTEMEKNLANLTVALSCQ